MAYNEMFENRAQEIVPIKAERVFDSCSDKDCLADLPVTLDCGVLPCQYTMVKCKNVWVENVSIDIEPLNFNRGFYSVDITYTFRVELCVYEKMTSQPVKLYGTAAANKNCVLYGSDISTTSFSTAEEYNSINFDSCTAGEDIKLPTATVQVAKPVVLEAKIGNYFWGHHHHHHHGCGCDHNPPPPPPCGQQPMPLGNQGAEGVEMPNPNTKMVYLTLGLFSVIELSRPVTVLAATYEYTIPTKECHNISENPCKAFDKLSFPTDEFAPQTLPADAETNNCNCGCGCN
ncbi:MAG: hypothetical protein LBM93_03130 [Oscillospiraceae bacterium]|jgi:hypothetical protein|nr:hypothetical protein [Oscillospiraceae bacterium]